MFFFCLYHHPPNQRNNLIDSMFAEQLPVLHYINHLPGLICLVCIMSIQFDNALESLSRLTTFTGDISLNPCTTANFKWHFQRSSHRITNCTSCDNCDILFHKSCLNMFVASFDHYCLSKSPTWICPLCHFPIILD